MPVETANFISQLNDSYPLGSDDSGDGDNHLRLIKAILKAQFPEFTAVALNATQAEIENAIAAVTGFARILLQDGSAAAPAIAFASDGAQDTGFYYDTDGYINITCNGVYAGKFGPGGSLSLQGGLTLGGVQMPFPSGTSMLFRQTAAPTGWTKSVTHNDKALRVVSGAVGAGGSLAFSTVFSRTQTDETTLTAEQMPVHNHGVTDPGHNHAASTNGQYGISYLSGGGGGGVTSMASASVTVNTGYTNISIQNAGNDEAHYHGADMRVNYVDVIIATKD